LLDLTDFSSEQELSPGLFLLVFLRDYNKLIFNYVLSTFGNGDYGGLGYDGLSRPSIGNISYIGSSDPSYFFW